VEAIRFGQTGGPDVLELTSSDPPAPGPRELLVDVTAAGVNFIDTYHRSGLYPLDLPSGLGLEGAGIVIEAGEQAGFHVGARVAWADVMGSYASHVVIPDERAVPVPDEIDLDTAAAVMLQGMTAHYLCNSTVALDRDHTVLVYAAAGGVGRLLVQLAKRRGARILACTSSEAKAEEIRRLGAHEIVFYRDVDVPETVRELTDGHGVDVVYDSVGADTFEDSLRSLRPRGTMVSYGNASGPVPPTDLRTLAQHGSLFLTRPTLGHYTADHDELTWRARSLFDLLQSDQLDVLIHDRYPLAEAGRAHRDLQSGTTTGKLLLRP